MRLPGWLDVALEGGVLQLQQALADTVALRRALRGPWRTHALTLAERSKALWSRQNAIDAAIERARKRARLDARAKAVLPLVERLERERESLRREIAQLSGKDGVKNDTTFRLLVEVAEEQAWFESAWRRFRFERSGIGAVLAILVAGVPIACWLRASWGGEVPTLFDLREIRHLPQYWATLSLLLGCATVSWWRLGSWQWLGLKRGSLMLPALSGAAVTVYASMAYVDGAVGLGLGALSAAIGLCLSWACYAFWLPVPQKLVAPFEPADPRLPTEKSSSERTTC